MSFGEAIATCFRKYATFSGRASRPEFWWFYLFAVIVNIVGLIIQGLLPFPWHIFTLWVLVWLALLLPQLAVTIRRLHDTGRSGWWWWIGVIPLIGGITLLVFLCQAPRPAGARYDEVAV